jgi:hypothetical protein
MSKNEWISQFADRQIHLTNIPESIAIDFATANYESVEEFPLWADDPELAAEEDISYWD